jgi:hypothetical protein
MPIVDELKGATHVIAVRSYVPTPVFENSLARNGFRPASLPELADSAYTVWIKIRQ